MYSMVMYPYNVCMFFFCYKFCDSFFFTAFLLFVACNLQFVSNLVNVMFKAVCIEL